MLLCLACMMPLAAGQGEPGPGQGPGQGAGPDVGPAGTGSREAMWPAPSAEDWQKPCLITWQRNWEDALAVSRETGKPILVCVNMDGEIASEHYAGIRYRDPEIAKLYEPYVCVMASVYRHTPRDYDEEGKRILCPRFGSVTCGEHISIEPGLFKEFFDDKRIAPRHIGVELNGAETYDVYYAFDTDSVFKAIEDGIANRTVVPNTVTRGDRTIVERVASRDIQDRTAVEEAYLEGDRDLRQSLIEAVMEYPEADQIDLLRLAVFGFDMDLSKMARGALARSDSGAAFNLISEALRVPMEASEREALIGALARIGESTPKARMMAVVHQGLSGRSAVLDLNEWSGSTEAGAAALIGPDPAELEARIANQGEALASGNAETLLELAEAFLASAYSLPESEMEFARFQFRDALSTALEAEKLGAEGWRVNAVIALASYNLDDKVEAYKRAEPAVKGMPPQAEAWKSLALLELLVEERRSNIAQAVRGKTDWPAWSKAFLGTGHWLTDVHAAYAALARHPLGTDGHVVSHYDFLQMLSATSQASRVLDEGLDRFPDSWLLHDRLRGRVLREKGVDGLVGVYDAMLREEDAAKNLEWFAGYATIVAAEFHRRLGNEEKAIAAYDRALAHYERAVEINPESRDTADHYMALALAGKARLSYESKDYDRALEEIVASFERKPDAAATPDGLNISPVDTAKMLVYRLKALKKDEMAAQLESAMGKLDPEMLLLPAYEREGPSQPRRRGPNRGRRGQ